jgi:tRNA-specific 2-thiouridylase
VQLFKGRDPKKDQSYFLFSLRQEQLAHVLFPLGEKTKSDTRDVARACSLRTADKEESMEICFVPDRDYGKFLREADLVQSHRGEIVDTHGRQLGEHDGVEFYTIGQRRGLGISSSAPLYVVELDVRRNRVVVGEESELYQDRFELIQCNWIVPELAADECASFECVAKIRYNHPGVPATVHPHSDGAAVQLHDPARAVTPGQACVCYDGERVLGGGWIRSVPPSK